MFKYIIWSEFISMQSILWTSCATLSSLFIRFKTDHFCIFQYSMTLNQIRNICFLFKWLIIHICILIVFCNKITKDSSCLWLVYLPITLSYFKWTTVTFSWKIFVTVSCIHFWFLEHYSFFWFPFPCCFFYLYQLGVYEGICKDTHTGY